MVWHGTIPYHATYGMACIYTVYYTGKPSQATGGCSIDGSGSSWSGLICDIIAYLEITTGIK